VGRQHFLADGQDFVRHGPDHDDGARLAGLDGKA